MKSLAERVKDFSWYQTIEFTDGTKTVGIPWCGDPLWPAIKEFTGSLHGKRVLDLGSNAGIFCVRAALDGASSCVGIESDTWKEADKYYEQAIFVREQFERMTERQLPIEYIRGDMDHVLDRDLGKFDWCFAIASLYYSQDPGRVISRMYQICDNVLLRLRDTERIEKLTSLFEHTGFCLAQCKKEDWSHLPVASDEFYLYHYVREF